MKRYNLFLNVLILSLSFLFTGFVKAHGAEHKILKGKIVDITCLLTHNSQGDDHKQCAMQCALKGLPFGILAEDGLIYQIVPIGHVEPKTVNATLLEYLEERVVLEGDVFQNHGTRVVMISKISKM